MRKLLNKKMFVILLMGISSGLPLALVGGTLQAWMRSEGVDLKIIGLTALFGLPYSLKFLWSPLMDRFTLNRMGRRRSWMLVTQIFLTISILALGWGQPQISVMYISVMALAVAFFSASQDIVVDAWRREALSDLEMGLGSSVHVNGYLIAMRLISGALALILSDRMSWAEVYTIMAGVQCLGILATFLADEPESHSAPKTLKESVIDPFLDYFSRPGAVWILIFILLYKLGDNMALQMTTPFYIDLGYTKTEIGAISKLVGWISLAAGSVIGGFVIFRIKILPSLFLFGIFQAFAIIGFALLSQVEKSTTALAFVIGADNFAVGMGTSAFVAFMATLTNKKFTATQYALLTSFMGVPRTVIPAITGYLAEQMGYFVFFLFCAAIAIPGILMIPWLRKFQSTENHETV